MANLLLSRYVNGIVTGQVRAMECSSCGHACRDGARFCANCASSLSTITMCTPPVARALNQRMSIAIDAGQPFPSHEQRQPSVWPLCTRQSWRMGGHRWPKHRGRMSNRSSPHRQNQCRHRRGHWETVSHSMRHTTLTMSALCHDCHREPLHGCDSRGWRFGLARDRMRVARSSLICAATSLCRSSTTINQSA